MQVSLKQCHVPCLFQVLTLYIVIGNGPLTFILMLESYGVVGGGGGGVP